MKLIKIRHILALVIATLFIVIATSQTNTTLAQGSNCSTSSPAGTYSITVCITAPANNATISGMTNVTTSISWVPNIPSAHPTVSKLIFNLGPDYLLTAFQPPFTFALPSDHFVDATYNLSVTANLSDGKNATPAAISLTFANGVTSPPTNPNTFTPYIPPASGSPLIVAATGDGASGEHPEVTNRIDAWNPGMFLYLGDVYEKGTYSEFLNWYGTPSTFFGQFRSITNPIIGNHEYENFVAPGYYYYWDNIPNYYSYDAGGWHFIALNSTTEDNETAPGSPQYQWLVQDLANSTALCTIAYFHHPRYNIGSEGPATRLSDIWDLFYLNGVDVVLTGHDHSYQRWQALDLNGNPNASKGITQFVVGTGGHGVQQFINNDSRMLVGYDTAPNAFGALKMTLGTSSMMYQYIPGAGTGVPLDSGTISCHSKPVDTTPPTAPSGLTATPNSIGQVDLHWNASTDATRVVGYRIYRDGAILTTVSGQTLNYTDTTIVGHTTYTYRVDAFDFAPNYSALSNPATILTPDIRIHTFSPTADSYVSDSSPDTNFGLSPFLRTDVTPLQRSYLRFDVSGLSGYVLNAVMQVFANNGNPVGYSVSSTSGGWIESGVTGITYNNAPGLGSTLGNSGTIAANSWTQVDVTSFVTGAGSYNFVMSTNTNTSTSFSSRSGSNPPQLVVRAAGPPNDNFGFGIPFSSLLYSNTQSNELASIETGEQTPTCELSANIRNTVWYTYTAGASQKVTFSVTDSSVVKGISVWTGSSLGALTQVGCGTGVNAAARVDVNNGTTYYIRVGTSNGINDNFTVQADVSPANDDFTNAITINIGFVPFTNTQDVIGASLETGDPVATCGGVPNFRTVWYKYVALASNVISLNTTDSNYNTVLSVWTGTGLGALTQVGCNDDNGGMTSGLTLTTAPGVTYFIRVSSKGSSFTTLKLNASVASTAGAPPLRNYLTTATPTLTWNRVTDAMHYEVHVSKSSTFTVLVFPAVIVPSNRLSITIGVDNNPPNPLLEGLYYWRVRAIRNGVAGAWSAFDSFVVDLP